MPGPTITLEKNHLAPGWTLTYDDRAHGAYHQCKVCRDDNHLIIGVIDMRGRTAYTDINATHKATFELGVLEHLHANSSITGCVKISFFSLIYMPPTTMADLKAQLKTSKELGGLTTYEGDWLKTSAFSQAEQDLAYVMNLLRARTTSYEQKAAIRPFLARLSAPKAYGYTSEALQAALCRAALSFCSDTHPTLHIMIDAPCSTAVQTRLNTDPASPKTMLSDLLTKAAGEVSDKEPNGKAAQLRKLSAAIAELATPTPAVLAAHTALARTLLKHKTHTLKASTTYAKYCCDLDCIASLCGNKGMPVALGELHERGKTSGLFGSAKRISYAKFIEDPDQVLTAISTLGAEYGDDGSIDLSTAEPSHNAGDIPMSVRGNKK